MKSKGYYINEQQEAMIEAQGEELDEQLIKFKERLQQETSKGRRSRFLDTVYTHMEDDSKVKFRYIAADVKISANMMLDIIKVDYIENGITKIIIVTNSKIPKTSLNVLDLSTLGIPKKQRLRISYEFVKESRMLVNPLTHQLRVPVVKLRDDQVDTLINEMRYDLTKIPRQRTTDVISKACDFRHGDIVMYTRENIRGEMCRQVHYRQVV